MPHVLIIHHKVRDYAKFKANFDDHKLMRKSGGEKSYQLYHKENDPDDLVLLFEWDNMENFQKFAQSKELQQAQAEAGLVDQPEIFVLEEIEKGVL